MSDASDKAHVYAAELDPATATQAEVTTALDLYRRSWWLDGTRSPGTIAWFLADFLPAWLASTNERAIELSEAITAVSTPPRCSRPSLIGVLVEVAEFFGIDP